MTAYEKIALRLVGTPLQTVAAWLRHLKNWPSRRAHPELADLYAEDSRMRAVLAKVVKADSRCIDVGCHLGVFLNDILTAAPHGQHIAVEPVPNKAALLQRKFPKVKVVEGALSDSTGETSFFVNDKETAYSGLQPRDEVGHSQAMMIRTFRLDDLVGDIPKVDFIKIDVNGADLMVLRGASGILLKHRPVVLLECTKGGLDNFKTDPREIFDYLTSVSYGVFTLKGWLSGQRPLTFAEMVVAMVYPFKAFNFVLDASRTNGATPGAA